MCKKLYKNVLKCKKNVWKFIKKTYIKIYINV